MILKTRWAALAAAALLSIVALWLLLPDAAATASNDTTGSAATIGKQPRFSGVAGPPPAAPAAVSAGTITGAVVADGAPVPGVTIRLHEYSEGVDRPVLTTTTTITGFFRFADPPTPPSGFTYYAYFGPNKTNPAYVFEWFGQDISFSPEGAGDAGALDITNVPLLSPPAYAVGLFPVTFRWDTRSVPHRAYYVDLADPATGITIGQGFSAGSASQVTFAQPSDMPNLVLTKMYHWVVTIYDTEHRSSYGRSFEARPITFATQALYLPLLTRGRAP